MGSPRTSEDHRVRILLVDDNSNGLAARKSVLEELGFSIVTSGSVEEALRVFDPDTFDLVITDYKLPDENGLKLIEAIRKRAPSVPIILISGFVDTLGLDEKRTGADAVIQKSANEVSHLLRAVNRLVKVGPRKPPTSHRPALRSRRRSG
jgi:CheY-like chemotaxis protein